MKKIAWMGSLALALALPASASANAVPSISNCHAGNLPKTVFQDCIKRQGKTGSKTTRNGSAVVEDTNQEEAQNAISVPRGDAPRADTGGDDSSQPAGMQEREDRSANDVGSGEQYAGPIDRGPNGMSDGPPDDRQWGAPGANEFDEDGPPEFGPPDDAIWNGRDAGAPDDGAPPGDDEDDQDQ